MPFRPDSSRRARLLGIALLLATFVAGGLGGAAMTRALQATQAPPAAGPPTPCERRQRILDQLDLTAEQRAQVDRILERRRAETEHFWDSAGPRLRVITDSTRAEIRALLTPEQQAEYDRLRAERKAAHQRRGEGKDKNRQGA